MTTKNALAAVQECFSNGALTTTPVWAVAIESTHRTRPDLMSRLLPYEGSWIAIPEQRAFGRGAQSAGPSFDTF